MSMQINKDLKINYNKKYLEIAKECKPILNEFEIEPIAFVKVVQDKEMLLSLGTEVITKNIIETKEMGKDDEIIIDFGTHVVGGVHFDIETVGSPPDAPLLFDIQYAEMPIEFNGSLENYKGWISKSWIQTARECIDEPNTEYYSKRRYAFRYVKIKIWDTSQKYKAKFKNIKARSYSAVDVSKVAIKSSPEFKVIAEVSLRTLQNCMQNVYEDGPKRDRRLWLGDLYLEAQANYCSFKDVNLVKRCLYLFAGTLDQSDRVAANIFVKPHVLPDDTYLVDYSLHFVNTLCDYMATTNDLETVKELYNVAKQQVGFALTVTNKDDLFIEQDYWWSFMDWNDELLKATATHGLFIFTLKNMRKLAKKCEGQEQDIKDIDKLIARFSKSALNKLYNEESGLFICNNQYSIHSQMWMVLADILSRDEKKKTLKSISNLETAIQLTTPYAQHFYVEALFDAGLIEEAKEHIKTYWGGMIELGADTFWELYDPNNIEFSPYGDHLANSYCHAWSCTPVYFIDKYNL
ncbi:MAG: hypothetical protein ACK5G7_01950 [Erysipelotrichaceae bacterium]